MPLSNMQPDPLEEEHAFQQSTVLIKKFFIWLPNSWRWEPAGHPEQAGLLRKESQSPPGPEY